MRRLPSRARGLAKTASLTGAASTVLALAAGCSAGGATSAAATLGPGLPSVGACRVLTTADITPASNETPTVPCSKPHTSLTIAVGGFPADQVTNQNLTDGTLGNLALQRCTAAWSSTVGGTTEAQHTSLLGVAYYLPDRAQLSGGARWYRCDVVVGGQDGLPLQDLPAKVDGILDSDVPASVQACRTAPDFTSGHTVPCDQPHVLKAVGTTQLPGGDRYPGRMALSAASVKGCAAVVRTWLHGRRDAGDAYQWPDQTGWTVLHDRTATCWTVTRS